MTRETKLGIVVAGSFMALVMGVIGVKYIFSPSAPTPDNRMAAQTSLTPTVLPEPARSPADLHVPSPASPPNEHVSGIQQVRNDFPSIPDAIPPTRVVVPNDPVILPMNGSDLVVPPPPADFDPQIVPPAPPLKDDFSANQKKNPVLRIQPRKEKPPVIESTPGIEPVFQVENREPKKVDPPKENDAPPAFLPPDAPPMVEIPPVKKEKPMKKEPALKLEVPLPTIDLLPPEIPPQKDILPGFDQPKLEIVQPKIEMKQPKVEVAPLKVDAAQPKIEFAPRTEVVQPKVELAPMRTEPMPPAEISLGTPKVEANKQDSNFDEDLHSLKPTDNYRTLSKQYYNSEAYAAALQRYNKDNPGQADYVRVPPIWVLEKKYSSEVGGSSGTARSVNYTVPPTAEIAPSNGSVYTVNDNGQMLADIARTTLGSEDAWKRIWDMNPQLNPAKVVPGGTRLRMPEGFRTQ